MTRPLVERIPPDAAASVRAAPDAQGTIPVPRSSPPPLGGRPWDGLAEDPPRWRLPAWVALGWLLYGAVGAAQIHFFLRASGTAPAHWWGPSAVTFSKALAWFGLTVLIVRLARRVPLAPRPGVTAVLVHLAAAAAAVFVDAAVESGVRSALLEEPVPILPIVTARTDVVLFYYTAIVAIVHAGAYWQRLRMREVEAIRLESALTSARLTQLQAQLQPHFLFNALQAIASLIDDDPAVAQRMIDSLSRLLRLLLESRAEQRVPLARELEMLHCYVDIERVRHEDWLSFDIAADEAALDVPVPNFMLQPLVENAIRHGFRGIDRPGTITVRAQAGAGVLGIDVSDDGTGMHGETVAGFGIGLGALQERLMRLYGGAHRFTVEASPGRGTHIRIEVPLEAD